MGKFRLDRAMFREREEVLLSAGDLTVSAFRFESGIEALRIRGLHTTLIILPFRGQQIWSAEIAGVNVTMRSGTREPKASQNYLESFGSFFVHCGLTAIGAPAAGDTHPLHGEFPMAPMDQAWLDLDESPQGALLRIGACYEYFHVFRAHYRASPWIELRDAATQFEVGMSLTNLNASHMDFMYLAHVNFRPVDGGRLHYSARYDAHSVKLRRSVPGHLQKMPEYLQLLEEYASDPSSHHLLRAGTFYDPEIVYLIDYLADETGWAHSIQTYPDGTADWIAHKPDECPVAVRWLSRNLDRDCLALAEPATSGLEGYLAEKASGNVPVLGPSETWTTKVKIGRLNPLEGNKMREHIDQITDRSPKHI
jgi:Domain of unknown function (DUF4432)